MRVMRAPFVAGLFGLLVASCGPVPSSITIDLADKTQDVGAIVQPTFEAMTAQAAKEPPGVASPPAGGQLGSISGSLNYPSESLPAMYVTAFRVGTQEYQYVITAEGQQTYRIDGLAPGSYHVVAYTVGSQSFPAGFAGGYTQAVPCGLNQNCRDHGLIDVPVAAGQAVTGIKPADWYLVDGAFPAFPGQQGAAPDPTAAPQGVGLGSITGTLVYPSEGIPALRVVAFQIDGNGYHLC